MASVRKQEAEAEAAEAAAEAAAHKAEAAAEARKAEAAAAAEARKAEAAAAAAARANHPPTLATSVRPRYTDAACRARISGAVEIGLTVTADGLPTNIHVLKSLGYGLDESAMEAVRAYRFNPGAKANMPAAYDISQEVSD